MGCCSITGALGSFSSNYFELSLSKDLDTFELDQLDFKTLAECSYLENANVKKMYLYHSSS